MTTKIAISLPDDLLKAIEKEREVTGESRSAFLRRAVELLIMQKQEREASEKYMHAYKARPESEEEIEAARTVASTILAEEPWS